MAKHRKKMYVNAIWESVIDLGRSLPRVTTLAVMKIGLERGITASAMFMYINYMIYMEDMFCFSVRMALRILVETAVSFGRVKVGDLLIKLRLAAHLSTYTHTDMTVF